VTEGTAPPGQDPFYGACVKVLVRQEEMMAKRRTAAKKSSCKRTSQKELGARICKIVLAARLKAPGRQVACRAL
jgi:hypothetical protein